MIGRGVFAQRGGTVGPAQLPKRPRRENGWLAPPGVGTPAIGYYAVGKSIEVIEPGRKRDVGHCAPLPTRESIILMRWQSGYVRVSFR